MLLHITYILKIYYNCGVTHLVTHKHDNKLFIEKNPTKISVYPALICDFNSTNSSFLGSLFI